LLKEVVAHCAITRMPAEALDMALDDLVSSGRKTGKGKGKGNTKGGFKSRFQGKGRSKGKRNGDDAKEGKKADLGGDKLEMSLEEVIGNEKGKGKGRKGRNNDEGKGKSRGKGKNWDDDYGSRKGRGKDKGYSSKGYSKGDRWGGDKGSGKDRGPQVWSEHDDRDGFTGGDDDRSWGKGRDSGKGMGRRPALSGRSGGGMSDPRARVREDRDGWQRVEQSAPIRDNRRDEPPPRRRAAAASPPRRREVGGGVKRRGEEPERAPASKRRATDEGSSKAKSVKVTNIPRDVTMEDIKEAFEAETGRITRCRLDRGTAWIAFTRHEDAKKAIDTFDRGELNGKQIGVVLDA